MKWLRGLLVLTASLALVGSAVDAGQIVSAAQDGAASAAWQGSKPPLVLEMGRRGFAWKQIADVRLDNGRVTWPAKKDRQYLVTTPEDAAREQLTQVRRSLGHAQPPVTDPEGELASAIRWAQKQEDTEPAKYAETRMRLSGAMAALLGLQVDVVCGVQQKVWPEQWLPLEASAQCPRSDVRVRFSSFSVPDNWEISGKPAKQWHSALPAAPVSRVKVRLPAMSVFYRGDYPVMAWYDVNYRGLWFRVTNAVEAEIVHPIETQGQIVTLSDTQINFTVQVKSLLPIDNVRPELSLPDGWKGVGPLAPFDLHDSKTLTYRITRPAGESGLRIVGAVFRIGDYGTSRRLITDHEVTLGERTSVTGLSLVQPDGDESPRAEILGRVCRKAPVSQQMLFNVSENFSPGEATFVTVEMAAAAPAQVWVSFRTSSGDDANTEVQDVSPSDGWHSRVFVVRNARFDGSYTGGADLQLHLVGDTVGVSRLRISRFGRI